MRPYIDTMRENIAKALKIESDQINVKATQKRDLDLPEAERGFPLRQSVCWKK